MISSLRIASALLFFIGAHLLVPRIADAAAKLNPPFDYSESSVNVEINKQTLSREQLIQRSQGEYEPPNYGGPNSEHGSGTR